MYNDLGLNKPIMSLRTLVQITLSIIALFLLFYVLIGFAHRWVNKSLQQYTLDHECVVTETKTKTHLQPVFVGTTTTLIPIHKKHAHYICKIDGERGTNFWH